MQETIWKWSLERGKQDKNTSSDPKLWSITYIKKEMVFISSFAVHIAPTVSQEHWCADRDITADTQLKVTPLV